MTTTGAQQVSLGQEGDAEKIAQSNPYISSIRVYEVMSSRLPTRNYSDQDYLMI